MQEPGRSLPVHEWLAVIAILSMMIAFVFIISFRKIHLQDENFSSHYIVSQKIEIYLDGAATQLGRVYIKKGSIFRHLLEMGLFSEDADLNQLDLKKKLHSGERVFVPSIQAIVIFITGAVEKPYFLTIPKGVKMYELIPFLEVNSEANLKRMPKKRCLQEGDKITIPMKKRSI